MNLFVLLTFTLYLYLILTGNLCCCCMMLPWKDKRNNSCDLIAQLEEHGIGKAKGHQFEPSLGHW